MAKRFVEIAGLVELTESEAKTTNGGASVRRDLVHVSFPGTPQFPMPTIGGLGHHQPAPSPFVHVSAL
ncbi:MAG TPA: hypothetical protein VFF73_07480 [Planctomycetota bacterium]|nr:hypothetical protein [Planctomycetota bacterium]